MYYLVRPYTDDICKYWRFQKPTIAKKSAQKIYEMYADYRYKNDFVGMDMCRKFLEMGFTSITSDDMPTTKMVKNMMKTVM